MSCVGHSPLILSHLIQSCSFVSFVPQFPNSPKTFPKNKQDLCEAFEAVFDGRVRAYQALGLLDGDTRLATQLANLLLGHVRVTPHLKLTLWFSEDQEAYDRQVREREEKEAVERYGMVLYCIVPVLR